MIPKNRSRVHPGEILNEEFLKPLGVTQSEFAKHFGWSHAKINEIVNGKRGISPEVALSLSDALGTSAELWLNLQKSYDLWHAKQSYKPIKKLKKVA